MSIEGSNPEGTVTDSGAIESPQPTNEPEWFLDDNTPGQGARPSWLPQKYKRASDLGKAYLEAEQRLGGFTGAPEEYNLTDLELDESQFVIQELKSVGKELNMSEDGMKKLLGRLHSAVETESSANMEDQLKKLGKDGERMLKEYNNWTKDYLKPEQAEVVKGWIKTAEDLSMFNTMMSHSNMTSVPTSQSVSLANSHESVADLRQEMVQNIQKYENDKNYRSNLSKRLGHAVEREQNKR